MSAARLILIGLLALAAPGISGASGVSGGPRPGHGTRFEVIEVLIDAGPQPLAAWQVEIRAASGQVRIVGIEGGEHAAFAEPPYYDERAMRGERVIIAAFSTGSSDRLPRGETRVATIHVQVIGDEQPRYESTMEAAATTGGVEIDATVHLVRGMST